MKNHRIAHRSVALIILLLATPAAFSNPIYIDFGREDNTTAGNYNNVSGPGGSTTLGTPEVELIDSTGADTGITLLTSFATGGSWAGAGANYSGPYPAVVDGQPATALEDSMFIRSPATAMLTLTGLDAVSTYDILIYGGRGNNGGEESQWTITDKDGAEMLGLDPFNNETETVLFSGLTPNANNEIFVDFTTTTGAPTSGGMNFMQITPQEVGGSSFQITSIDFDPAPKAPSNTVTWKSVPDRNYAVFYSTDLNAWNEINDSVPSGGESTSFEHLLLPLFSDLVDAPVLFYRVELVIE